ncbi:site-specific integrase [Polynucleobacter sp. AP-Ainpum-60-G11]|uniref:site-specific integrase n=1 Tax=Polynucleobacter sp. AP-Ainpum-60-G11 TaxID=2576926 RepID=UPI001BFED743|nr:site-specific integrase [Polynucleobacter sp. AP-Ainpum-60-G11]QWE25972.1 site-specific integrase [Polynucleobacter sp. AP-Ainpum-60-G11]
MANLTGLFQRGSIYYVRIVLPREHQLRSSYKNGCYVATLGTCTYREALLKGTIKRAEILGYSTIGATNTPLQESLRSLTLSQIFIRWQRASPRSRDSLNACKRSLRFYEEFTKNPPINELSREQGDGFRAWLQAPDRNTTSKTARDRLVWIKSLIKYAQVDLGLLQRHPWEGIDIKTTTTHKRRPWDTSELQTLFGQALHTSYSFPRDWRAGADASYWIPLLGLFMGARLGELSQLRVIDICTEAHIPVISITDECDFQKVKTPSSIRKIPIHSELIRLGFLDYVSDLKTDKKELLWSDLSIRKDKPGGYFSNWFGEYRKSIGLSKYPDFHCFRHTVRSQLAEADVSEAMIDSILGHQIKGSAGAKIYSHKTVAMLSKAIETLSYSGLPLQRIYRGRI